MSSRLKINEDFEKDYPKFKFPGFWGEGQCFLRVRGKQGRLVFLCVQLKSYSGTSVTNAVERIFSAAVKQLYEDRLIGQPKSKVTSADLTRVAKNSDWIEHYPPGAHGRQDSGSYSLVSFDTNLNPVWNYMAPEEVITYCHLESRFLAIPPKFLKYGD